MPSKLLTAAEVAEIFNFKLKPVTIRLGQAAQAAACGAVGGSAQGVHALSSGSDRAFR